MASDPSLVETAKTYFERVDARREDVAELFTDDVSIYFPKFGVGHGKAALGELSIGLGGIFARVEHDVSTFLFLQSGNFVTVEGTTTGVMQSGESWTGGTTPGGRFCNVFEFRDGLIARLHVYLDPDYISADTDRFLWGRDRAAW